MCRADLDVTRLQNVDSSLLRLLDSLAVYCSNKPNGCTWQGAKSKLLREEHVCEHVKCNNRDCGWLGKASALAEHTATSCLVGLVNCAFASQGCDFVGRPRKELPQHQCRPAQLQRRRALLDSLNPAPDSIVRLNVGGKLFVTSRGTLSIREPDSLLADVFCANRLGGATSAAIPLELDPEIFTVLLRWLRLGVFATGATEAQLSVFIKQAELLGFTKLPLAVAEEQKSQDALKLAVEQLDAAEKKKRQDALKLAEERLALCRATEKELHQAAEAARQREEERRQAARQVEELLHFNQTVLRYISDNSKDTRQVLEVTLASKEFVSSTRDGDGNSVLHLLCALHPGTCLTLSKLRDLVSLALKQHPPPVVQNRFGQTPNHLAASSLYRQHPDAIYGLLPSEGNTVKDSAGKTAAQLYEQNRPTPHSRSRLFWPCCNNPNGCPPQYEHPGFLGRGGWDCCGKSPDAKGCRSASLRRLHVEHPQYRFDCCGVVSPYEKETLTGPYCNVPPCLSCSLK